MNKLKGNVIIVVSLVMSYTGSMCMCVCVGGGAYSLVIEVLQLLLPILNDLSPL